MMPRGEAPTPAAFLHVRSCSFPHASHFFPLCFVSRLLLLDTVQAGEATGARKSSSTQPPKAGKRTPAPHQRAPRGARTPFPRACGSVRVRRLSQCARSPKPASQGTVPGRTWPRRARASARATPTGASQFQMITSPPFGAGGKTHYESRISSLNPMLFSRPSTSQPRGRRLGHDPTGPHAWKIRPTVAVGL